MKNTMYTKEGLPIVSQEAIDSYSKCLEKLKIPEYPLAILDFIELTNPVLREYGSVMIGKLIKGDTIGDPTPQITYRIGFFETYQLLRLQGLLRQLKESNFVGIPLVDPGTIGELYEEFDKWEASGKYEENYSKMLEQIAKSNPLLYKFGVNAIDEISWEDSEIAHTKGFVSVIELLRKQQEINSLEVLSN